MISDAQLSANRKNALLSTGPKTQDGKRRTAQNSVTHGLTATSLLIEDENPQDLKKLERSLRQELTPVGVLQEAMLQRIVSCLWRLQRIGRLEASILNFKYFQSFPVSTTWTGRVQTGTPIRNLRNLSAT